MKKFACLTILIAAIALPCVALAQTLTSDSPKDVGQIALELVTKLVLPAVITLAGPFAASLIAGASPWVKVALAGVVSMLTGAAAGEIPTLPLSPESSGNMGLAMGLIGEMLRQRIPKESKTVEAKP
jgi:hypothetical protein